MLASVIGAVATLGALVRGEQVTRALWKAVRNVDLRPTGHRGDPVPGGEPGSAAHRAFEEACAHCHDKRIAAWFNVRYELPQPHGLLALPEVVQNYFVLLALLTMWGGRAGFLLPIVQSARTLGVKSDEDVLIGLLNTQGKGFRYALGASIPDMEAELRRGGHAWNRASQEERDALVRGSLLCKDEHLSTLVAGIASAGIAMPSAFSYGIGFGAPSGRRSRTASSASSLARRCTSRSRSAVSHAGHLEELSGVLQWSSRLLRERCGRLGDLLRNGAHFAGDAADLLPDCGRSVAAAGRERDPTSSSIEALRSRSGP